MSATGRTPAEAAPDGARVADRYRLLRRVGSGGMAEVFRAHDELLGRDVALKVFRREFASADDLRRQKGEVRILANLSHPSLVTLFDTTSDEEGRGVLILEFVDGTDAGARLKEGPLPAAAVAALGLDIARALAYIHAKGVVHRDIAPANILLPSATSSAVAAKLTDLGIARLVDDARITSTGFVIGTASYLSPEQAAGRPVGPPSDVYSLGLVLLECLTGKREFTGSGVESAVARLSRDPDVPETLDAEWRRLIRSMVAREPDHRPTAAVVAEQLSALLARGEAPGEASGDALDRTLLLPSADEDAAAAPPHEPTAATTVLPGAPVPTAAATSALPGTRPAPARPAATTASRFLRPLLSLRRGMLIIIVACVALVVVVIAIALGTMSGGGQSSPDPVKSYPAVGGTLGDHLRQLEHDVSNSGP
ncbi:serine/threonine-protein kinase [Leifsonia shinshuensis]|uniref:non-specific serine/threonine protein kinase n=1 Tax=Leifsonia shinshuensis TaxID=150026 RepID=A0A7G6YDZ1_9MICO|nr:serine/threonine-protein kinase [Leifsonia shinshuensis]QNE36706.1 serine/threonine protein kinase [Leifsonia shinshuensis]